MGYRFQLFQFHAILQFQRFQSKIIAINVVTAVPIPAILAVPIPKFTIPAITAISDPQKLQCSSGGSSGYTARIPQAYTLVDMAEGSNLNSVDLNFAVAV